MLSRIILATLCLYAIVRAIAAADTVMVPISSYNFQNWDLSQVQHSQRGSDYYLLRCEQPCYVIAPPLSYFGIAPLDYPYVTVSFDPGSVIRDFRILVSGPDSPGEFNTRPALPSGHDRLFCDLRESRPWNRLPPFPSRLERVGFVLSGTILLRQMQISNYLSLSDYARLLYSTLTNVEPSAPYLINDLYGLRLFGWGQVTAAFLLFGLCLLLQLSFARSSVIRQVSLSGAVAFLFLYLPSAVYLARDFRLAQQHSSFHYDPFDEYASCYGEDFSFMSRTLHNAVPPGSRVHFLKQLLDGHPTEYNLVEFIHRTLYVPETFGNADYYFCFRWPEIYNRTLGSLKDPLSAKSISVELVYEQGDSFILKAVR